jgi:chromate reductase
VLTPRPHSRTSRRRVLAIAGSLRASSYNRALADAAVAHSPAGMDVTVYRGLGSVPMFDQDLEAPHRLPGSVRDMRALVASMDGLLLVTPEYNQSVPGVLKNAIDWLSRPSPGSVLEDLPVAVTGATTGPWGTRLAQAEIRHTLFATGAIPMPVPALYVGHAADLFSAGRLDDAPTIARLAALLERFETWIDQASQRPVTSPAQL